jgi:anaerobic nitric oxide reductase flavorubredoxin
MLNVIDNIYYIGKRDWELRHFHGHELSTYNGTSYNAYYIKDEKNVIVDTVWDRYEDEFLETVEKEIGLDSIDYIVINHVEPDHGGSLGAIMERRPDIPIVCSVKGADIIKRHFHKDWNFITVKTGDTLPLGKTELVFVEMTMIHWPDSMMTFVKGPGVLLSNDAFGQHYAGAFLFSDQVDETVVWQEALKYFAGILTPFAPLIVKKVREVEAMNLPIKMIAPSHGVIWRREPLRIVKKYAEWADAYNEGSAVVIYDTMYQSTRRIAEAIAAGIESRGVACRLFNGSLSDVSDLIVEIFKAKGIIIGSCTVNNSYLRSISGILDEIAGHKFKNKIGAAFGSYGWSGEAHEKISRELESAGISVVQAPISFKYRPEPQDLEECFRFGCSFADRIK